MNEIPESSPSAGPADTANVEMARRNQSLTIASGAGLVAALIGAVAWAVITITTEYQIGFMAIGLGLLVGFAVRLGKGVDKVFGVIGGVLALFGCLLGNFLTIVGFVAKEQQLSLPAAFAAIDYANLVPLMTATFQAMDLLFYGLAVYEGYRFSIHQVATPATA